MSQFYCILCVFSRVYFSYFYYIIPVQIYTCLLSYIQVGGLYYSGAKHIAHRIAGAYLTDRRFPPTHLYLS